MALKGEIDQKCKCLSMFLCVKYFMIKKKEEERGGNKHTWENNSIVG